MPGPLSGVRVVDIAERPAGQFAGRILADLGADVIRIAASAELEAEQCRGEDGDGVTAVTLNAGKVVIAAEDRDELHALVERLGHDADVIVVDAIDPEDVLAAPSVSARHPEVVVCSVTPFGLTGPLAGRAGSDATIQGLSGVLYTTGQPGQRPYLTPTGYNDTMSASHAVIAIIHALRERLRAAGGQWIDIAMLDVAVAMDCENMPVVLGHRGAYRPEPLGHGGFANTLATFRSPEGWIVMEVWGSGPDSMWGRLAQATGRAILLEDPRFHDDESRLTHLDDVLAIVEEWLAEFASDADAIAALHAAKVTAGQVRTPDLVIAHPQLVSRGAVREVSGGRVIAMPYRFSGTPVAVGDRRDVSVSAAAWQTSAPDAERATR